MSKPVRVPDPVYDQLIKEADRKDVSLGAVVGDWMHEVEKYRNEQD